MLSWQASMGRAAVGGATTIPHWSSHDRVDLKLNKGREIQNQRK